ncbi:DUF4148 domain-containing protein [Pararobbsia silviterrae]|uniref:DUF4148 domain-containing protein n=1 Tax=Pararobbsia silviterrae TaxID=1792498 RepID=A0A494XJF7_9BURK|nr:DUF4148 domain-containing protein [Pararobbsia silviterrae]RKP47703.1 DUF4148 domain-containing protein [Pararobbsia silviterrae]
MKKLAIAAVSVALATLAGSAFADTTSGLTRAQVRADLVNAQREGMIPSTDTQYPPTAQEIAQNKALYQAQFGKSAEPQRWATGTPAQNTQG